MKQLNMFMLALAIFFTVISIASAETLKYDDGTSDTYSAPYSDEVGSEVAVRFTPTSYPARLQSVFFYVPRWQQYTTSFGVRVYDDDNNGNPGGTRLDDGTVTGFATEGNEWIEVSLSGQNIVISGGDFFASMYWTTPSTSDEGQNLGNDTGGHIYDRTFWKWGPNGEWRKLTPELAFYGNAMIRASVTSSEGSKRGMYVDDLDTIIDKNNTVTNLTAKATKLLEFAQQNKITYLALYGAVDFVFNKEKCDESSLCNFVRTAKRDYGVLEIGAVDGLYKTSSGAFNWERFKKIISYNSLRDEEKSGDAKKFGKFDILNLEHEFWKEGDFELYMTALEEMSKSSSLKTETYVGWLDDSQAKKIAERVHRVLLHCYVKDPVSAYGYAKGTDKDEFRRLTYFANANENLEIWPNYSVEWRRDQYFMGCWFAKKNSILEGMASAEDIFEDAFEKDIAEWEGKIRNTGFIYYSYRYFLNNPWCTPAPDIRANGEDDAISVESGTPVSIKVLFDPGVYITQKADWWVVESTPSGIFNHYDISTGWMLPGLSATYEGPIVELGETQLLNSPDLTVGTHTFYFGVDLNMNGSLDMDSIYYDWVSVVVQ